MTVATPFSTWADALQYLEQERRESGLTLDRWQREVAIWREADRLLFSLPVGLSSWAIASTSVAGVEADAGYRLTDQFPSRPRYIDIETAGNA